MADKTNILACGSQSANKHMISEISLIEGNDKQNNSAVRILKIIIQSINLAYPSYRKIIFRLSNTFQKI